MSDAFWSGSGSSIAGSAGNFFSDLFFHNRTAKREDTAVQRRVADLKAAGLHPALAAGSAASASPASGVNPVDKMEPTESKADQDKRREIESKQSDLLTAQKDQTVADADLAHAKALGAKWDNYINAFYGQNSTYAPPVVQGIKGIMSGIANMMSPDGDNMSARQYTQMQSALLDSLVHSVQNKNRGDTRE